MRILVVEDSPDIRDGMIELLALEGYDVAAAEDGRAALALLESGTPLPELILLDLIMPGMDGYQFLEELRRRERISSIPVIIMTANQEAKGLGTTGFIRKPIAVDRLLAMIGALIRPSGG
jgi:CheY-like chemotaxis protein